MAKVYALVIFAAISLMMPMIEFIVTGRIKLFGNFSVVEAILSTFPIYWWYFVDKKQMQYRAGPLLNIGVIGLATVALPIYFIKSRGWKRGSIIIIAAVGVLAVTHFLGLLGAEIGSAIAS